MRFSKTQIIRLIAAILAALAFNLLLPTEALAGRPERCQGNPCIKDACILTQQTGVRHVPHPDGRAVPVGVAGRSGFPLLQCTKSPVRADWEDMFQPPTSPRSSPAQPQPTADPAVWYVVPSQIPRDQLVIDEQAQDEAAWREVLTDRGELRTELEAAKAQLEAARRQAEAAKARATPAPTTPAPTRPAVPPTPTPAPVQTEQERARQHYERLCKPGSTAVDTWTCRRLKAKMEGK